MMTNEGKLSMIKALSGESDDSIVSAYLYLTEQKILRMTCSDDVTEVPAKYDGLCIDATVYFLNKRGAESELSHSENGVSRTYESADIPTSMLRSYGIFGRCEVVS